MDLIKFVFSDVWIWLGSFMMLFIICQTVVIVVKHLSPWGKEEKPSYEERRIITDDDGF